MRWCAWCLSQREIWQTPYSETVVRCLRLSRLDTLQLKRDRLDGPLMTRMMFWLCKGRETLRNNHRGLNLPHSVLFPPKVNQHNEPRSKLSKSHWQDLYVPLNETIQPVWCPCVTEATVPCCTSRWSAMDLLRWAHLFPHKDDVTFVAVLGAWEGPAPPASTSNWHSETQISS